MLPENDDFLHFIDNLFRYHKKHLKLRNILKQHEELLIKTPEEFVDWIRKYKFADKQEYINVNIKAFFMLIMIELNKRIEGDDVFRGTLDECISMDGYHYYRLKYERKKIVDTITKQIKHFRDACVHKEDDKISTVPEFFENNIEGGETFLPFITNGEKNDWCFMIGKGYLTFDKLERIIECTLIYYYTIPERIKHKN